eukprot:273589_1
MTLLRCSVGSHVFAIGYTLVSSLFTITIISLSWSLIRGYRITKAYTQERTPSLLFYSALIFVFASIIILSHCILYGLSFCSYFTVLDASLSHLLFDIICTNLYVFQLYLLWIVFFIRLYYILRATAYALSVVIIRIYCAFFIISPLLTILLAIESLYITSIFIFFGLIGAILITSSLMILYILKLLLVYTHDDEDSALLTTITKNTILTVISTSFSSLILIILLMEFVFSVYNDEYNVPPKHQEQFLHICFLLDCSITTCCLIFQFQSLHSKYACFCGRIDAICRHCCKQFVNLIEPDDDAPIPHGHVSLDLSQSETEQSMDHIIHLEMAIQTGYPNQSLQESPLLGVDSAIASDHELPNKASPILVMHASDTPIPASLHTMAPMIVSERAMLDLIQCQRSERLEHKLSSIQRNTTAHASHNTLVSVDETQEQPKIDNFELPVYLDPPSPVELQKSQTCDSRSKTSQYEFDLIPDTENQMFYRQGSDYTICSEPSDLDAYAKLSYVSEKDIIKALSAQNIVFDSLLKVQIHQGCQGLLDVAAVLTDNALYFISAHNYQIWMEFRDRSKVMKFVSDWKDDVITTEIAAQIVKTLDLGDDEKTNDQIVQYCIGKTAHAIQLHIMVREGPIPHLAHVFGLRNDGSIKSVNYVRITNINHMNTSMIDRFMTFVFENIPWVDQQIKNKSVGIYLLKYHTPSIIAQLKERKTIFCAENSISQQVDISSWTKYKSFMHVSSKVVYWDPSCSVEPLDSSDDIPYGLTLKLQHDSLICKLQSNNCRHEWITHLDYVLYKLSRRPSSFVPQNFECKDNHNGDACIAHFEFRFGIYLHYWSDGYPNSVTAAHPTLKDELLKNRHSTIDSSTYYDLYEQSSEILQKRVIHAQDIGINNKKFRIPPGSLMTINHMIVLKAYTDCSAMQNEFKKHCRRQTQTESLQSIISRNCQIAHFCRYLKECCEFFGKTMTQDMVVYSGLNERFLFQSMMQHFECPLSTTTELNVANGFSRGKGIVLKLKRANPKTRYFDVSWLSHYKHEKEKLFMGSSLQIIDIYIMGVRISDRYWTKPYILAMRMFEQIVNGYFIDGPKGAERALSGLFVYVLGQTIMERVNSMIACDTLTQCLVEEEYDTDSILDDIGDRTSSNLVHIMCDVLSDSQQTKIQKIKQYAARTEERNPPAYITELFLNYVASLKPKIIWLNLNELSKYKHIKTNLLGKGKLLDRFGIDELKIKHTKEYIWDIKEDEYKEFMSKKPREYIESNKYDHTEGDTSITFHLQCFAKYSDVSETCAIFFHLDTIGNEEVNRIYIELDVLCLSNGIVKYRHLLPTQWLSGKTTCGMQTFPCKDHMDNEYITWKIGVKIHDTCIQTTANVDASENVQLNRENIDLIGRPRMDSFPI